MLQLNRLSHTWLPPNHQRDQDRRIFPTPTCIPSYDLTPGVTILPTAPAEPTAAWFDTHTAGVVQSLPFVSGSFCSCVLCEIWAREHQDMVLCCVRGCAVSVETEFSPFTASSLLLSLPSLSLFLLSTLMWVPVRPHAKPQPQGVWGGSPP